jgi:hypothetical protein
MRRRPSAATIIALLALFFALGGSAVAARHYLITSTSQIKPTVLKALRGTAGRVGPQGLQGPQGAQGAQGPAGAQGSAGPAGAPATALWAVVNAGGSLARGSGVINVTLSTNGGTNPQYNVQFNRDITACAYIANAGSPGTVSNTTFIVPRDVTTARSVDDSRTVVVEVFNTDQTASQSNTYTPVEDDFHLAVFC